MTYATLTQRQEARELVASPGKFENESPMVPILYAITLDGCADSETGDQETIGYWMRVGRWVLLADSQGFVTGRKFPTVDLAQAEIDAIDAMMVSDDDAI